MHDQSNEDDSVETHPVLDVDPVQDFVPPRDHFTQGRLPQTEHRAGEHGTRHHCHHPHHSGTRGPVYGDSTHYFNLSFTSNPIRQIFPRCLLGCYTSIIDGYFGSWPPSSFF